MAMLIEQPEDGFWLWLVATSGNNVTFFMGGILALRLQRSKFQSRVKGALKRRLEGMFILSVQRVDQLQSYGVWLLLLSWVLLLATDFVWLLAT